MEPHVRSKEMMEDAIILEGWKDEIELEVDLDSRMEEGREELEVYSKSSEEPIIPEGWKDENDSELEVDQVSKNEDGKERMEVDSKSRGVPNNDPNDGKTIPEGCKDRMEESQRNILSRGSRLDTN
jgi:hypothetical protein